MTRFQEGTETTNSMVAREMMSSQGTVEAMS